MAIRQLTAEEKALPYSKYYYRPVAAGPGADRAGPARQADGPREGPLPEDINLLLDPGYMEVETGWCTCPTAPATCVNNKMPGVTVDMLDWWFAWHSLAEHALRHLVPAGPLRHLHQQEDRKKVLDPNVPIKEKIYGRTDHVVEDVGTGPEDIYIFFCAPELGFDMSRFHAPNVAAMYGGYGLDMPQNAEAGRFGLRPSCATSSARSRGHRVSHAFLDGLHAHRRKPCSYPAGRVLPADVSLT